MASSENTLILYSSPMIGHLIPMVELAKLILKHHPSFSITFFLATPPPPQPPQATKFTTKYIATTPSITFHHLEPTLHMEDTNDSPFKIAHLNNQSLHKALEHLTSTQSHNIKAFILDFMCNSSFELVQSFNIPTYYFWTTSASGLTLLLHLPYLQQQVSEHKTSDHDERIQAPDMPPISWRDAPPPLTPDSSEQLFHDFMSTSVNMGKNCRGIIVNTFEELEPRAMKVLSAGICTPDVVSPTPVFSVGPLISSKVELINPDECSAWLQPSRSVVLLSFGSLGQFSPEQLVAIAEGLEACGHRFLWVVRNPSKEADDNEPSLDDLLPRGFLERTSDRGLVVQTWIEQREVLSHGSVGAFVTHCGWNSVLEAGCNGVPMIGWPLYAEQRMNRVFLVEVMKVALPLEMDGDGFVKAVELERRVREVMEMGSDAGEMVRRRVRLMCERGAHSLCDTGSSRTNLDKLVQSCLGDA